MVDFAEDALAVDLADSDVGNMTKDRVFTCARGDVDDVGHLIGAVVLGGEVGHCGDDGRAASAGWRPV